MKKTLAIFLMLSLSVCLTFAGLSLGGGGGHGHGHQNGASFAHKRHKSGSSQHIHIKGGIGNGYIYPAKSKHQKAGGHGNNIQTYKLIFENGGSHGMNSGFQHGAGSNQHGTNVKTYKVITENAASPISPAPVKTLKLIHVNGQNTGCSKNAAGWQ